MFRHFGVGPSVRSPAVPRVFQGSQASPSGWPALSTGRDQFSGESAFLFGGGNLEFLTSEVNRVFSLLSFLSVYLTRKHYRDWLVLYFVGFQHIWLSWITLPDCSKRCVLILGFQLRLYTWNTRHLGRTGRNSILSNVEERKLFILWYLHLCFARLGTALC